jgi:hypothetical protein
VTPRLRSAAIFAAVFLVVNLGIDVWQGGGLTAGALLSTLLTTAVATLVYLLFLRWQDSRRDKSE